MPIEIRNATAPDEVIATFGAMSAGALDDHVAREGIYGPALPAIAHDTVVEAAGFADGFAFSLSSCLRSERAGLLERLVAEDESGMLHFKTGSVPEIHLPLVGNKDGTVGTGESNGSVTIPFHATKHPVGRRASM
ncbi:MAG: aldehyde dehydrogenase family protein [Boseongicola sp. SB0676_bin_33]|uniref:Aldehyde dehydrogenase family protein n=1 Tax=Boseongicola sp. SB0664_bin_43 TaxID=2604844 RepID=A0A6B0Y1H8_9RHOB|nr:aldehyde dehydrogenase family protein [Boseongicola sp. SB0664_bin_43]MYF88037.1 aldehyde dehydrogenase family protein [Boseongicola sp. SB0676_bin_33]MYK31562.1 aldehyde dehydrogenase family protein [Boseongicola sp. SB0670_bin_30]